MSDVHISTLTDTQLQLDSAVLLYRSSNNNAVYATVHDVIETAGQRQIGAGRPLTVAEVADFAQAASARTAYQGFIDPRLLYVGPSAMAWWCPPRRRRVWFAADGKIGHASAETAHPGLVFVVHGRNWYVVAVRHDMRPSPSSGAYYAPYFNVWESGQICTGNVDLPDRPGPDAIKVYEDAFFRSRFTHSNYHGKSAVRRKGGLTQLWVDLLAGADFPETCLVSRKKTISDFINEIIKTKE